MTDFFVDELRASVRQPFAKMAFVQEVRRRIDSFRDHFTLRLCIVIKTAALTAAVSARNTVSPSETRPALLEVSSAVKPPSGPIAITR